MTPVTKRAQAECSEPPGDSVIDGVRVGLPFALADVLDGIIFGALAVAAGLTPLASVVMSATAFSGSAQYATLTVLRDHGTMLAVVGSVVALNARYLAYGASLAPAMSPGRLARAGQAQLMTDTSWALALRDGTPRRGILIGAGAASLVAWTLGTAVGVAAGQVIGDYRAFGLDAAVPAFFLCLLLERIIPAEALRAEGTARAGKAKDAIAAALGGAVALALTPFAPPGVPLLVVLVGALAWPTCRRARPPGPPARGKQ